MSNNIIHEREFLVWYKRHFVINPAVKLPYIKTDTINSVSELNSTTKLKFAWIITPYNYPKPKRYNQTEQISPVMEVTWQIIYKSKGNVIGMWIST